MIFDRLKGSQVEAWLWTPIDGVESVALDQLRNVASLPWVFHHVAVMPDVHFGKGATVGSVIAMKDAVAPAAVGVDIGCGMAAVMFAGLTASDLPDDLRDLRDAIEKAIPVGFNARMEASDRALRSDLWRRFDTLAAPVGDLKNRALRQCGTLGGGNHFIELCLDQDQGVWLMLHSGSRNIGKVLAEHHMRIAKTLTHNRDIPDRDLAVFLRGTREFAAYRTDLAWAQQYAFLNRTTMMFDTIDALQLALGRELQPAYWTPIMCHHNYVAEEIHYGESVIVTRKGAIRSGLNEFGIIPGSMGDKSYIVSGLGNPESFQSASHGAGRRMSRGSAKRTFTLEDLASQTRGVECRKDAGVLDEIPGAYKDIGQVMEYQSDLVRIIAELKQVLCVKG